MPIEPVTSPAALTGEAAAPPKIFISYRRQDARYQARDLHKSLAERFGAENVFFDLDP